ncbi:MAG: DNA topoisomerase 1 [Alphaproteobacteria bacterium MarineAlpha9_Bin4]|nr:DNA topoisomerase I [Pelagibacterales bacterium]PPR26685.1 MAG: DNA topoisomerase 1 [Alphaproteobacteria bacterium MarineAlpha9_Bin4]|tara:strand:- start:490 stop:2988 length:2499 start_codon:yes stop_codon:yes gene_type:complete
MNLVIVESPAKAKTINKFLGNDYEVIASYGHVRDIEEKKGIDVTQDFKINYQKNTEDSKYLNIIRKSIKDKKKLFLATDQDREGEAIAWHIKSILEEDNLLKDIEILRITFNEITKEAILNSLNTPRHIDMNLVNAYQARRSLDYLMGYSLSPLLIRKFPGCKSAGRVQSVALKLITERENEIQKFKPKEYWSIQIQLLLNNNKKIDAKLYQIEEKKITKLSIENESQALELEKKILNSKFKIKEIDSKIRKNNPFPPFITSTLQLDASNKLGFSPSRTMSLAQKLYEGININGENKGLITYMRTDSTNLSNEFIQKAKDIISKDFGKNYVYQSVRSFKNKVKNSQEAHEAIRPSDPFIKPDGLPASLEQDLKKLYDLIWRRSLSTQANQSVSKIISIKIKDDSTQIILSASTSELEFDGYKKIYQDEEVSNIQKNKGIDKLTKDTFIEKVKSETIQHFTDPPPRYTEASLIKKLEEYGIGRPSTYANIMKKNQLRGYVSLNSKRFIPQPSGRIVTCFLENYFQKYLDYNFTAKKEDELDLVSQGEKNWKSVLHEFWDDFNKSVEGTLKLSNTNVYDYINDAMKEYLFPHKENRKNDESKLCPKCKKSNLSIKMRKNGSGPFVACTSHPDCDFIRSEVFPGDDSEEILIENKILGYENNIEIILKKGPYGPYVQLGSDKEDKKNLKRASIPKNININDIDLLLAKKLLALPRDVGQHPETGEIIIANNGRYGPYLKYNGTFYSIPKDENPLTIGINRAIDIISKPKKSSNRSVKPLRDLGKHPDDNENISIYKGRYGLYVKYKGLNIGLPKSSDAQEISIKDVVDIIKKKEK